MRMLTGNSITTAPVYDDYTIGMRVLPLLGVIEAKAEEGYAYVHQGPHGKYLERMKDKQQRAWLSQTEEGENNHKSTAATTQTTLAEGSQAVNGNKSSTEVHTSVTAVETSKNGKSSYSTLQANDSVRTDATTLKSADIKQPDTPISETKSTESKPPRTTPSKWRVSSDPAVLEGPIPGSKLWYRLRYTHEERKRFALERKDRILREIHLRQQEEEALEEVKRKAAERPQTVFGRLGSVLSSWIGPTVGADGSFGVSEMTTAEQVSIPPANRTVPLPTVYREDEKFHYAESKDGVVTSKDIPASESTPSAKSMFADSTATKTSSPADAATMRKSTFTTSPPVISESPAPTPATTQSAAAISESPDGQENKFHLEPLASAQLDTQLRKAPQVSPIHFAVSPPTSTRPIVPSKPLSTSIYSASSLLLPGTPFLFPQPPTPTSLVIRVAITALSSSTPTGIRAPADLAKYYEEEIVKRRPQGLSAEEMRGLFMAWVGIEKRSAEGLSEESVRRAMRMSLVKAEEIAEARSTEREKRTEEERAAKEVKEVLRERERDVVLGMLGGKKVYPLTEPTTAATSAPTTESKISNEPTKASEKIDLAALRSTPSAQTGAKQSSTQTMQTNRTKSTIEHTNTSEKAAPLSPQISPSTGPRETTASWQATESKPATGGEHTRVESTNTSKSFNPEIVDSRQISERSRTGSLSHKSSSKNEKQEEPSRVAIKAKAILEKRRKNGDKFAEMMETKHPANKSEVWKAEDQIAENVGSDGIKVGETQTETKAPSIKSETSKTEEANAQSKINAKSEVLKSEETSVEAHAASGVFESAIPEGKVATTEAVHEPLPITTNTVTKHTIAIHPGPSQDVNDDIKPITLSKRVVEHKPTQPSAHPPPSAYKTQTKHSSKSSFFQRMLAITSAPSSESPVKHFIDLATDTFEQNLKLLGVARAEERGEKSKASGEHEKDVSPKAGNNPSSSSSHNVSALEGSRERGHELAMDQDNEMSEKVKRIGEKEFHVSEKRKVLRM